MTRQILLLLLFYSSFAQNSLPALKDKARDSVYSDCANARVIKLSGYNKIGPTQAPLSGGIVNEISKKKQGTSFTFEEEHHTAWYKLLVGLSGHLCFDIIPESAKDDYDFMLFKAGTNFCDSLAANTIAPVRACISRDKKELSGRTGLSYKSQKELVKDGVGDAYVKPLEVKAGETYYLVLDNVYKNGLGHTIIFDFREPFEIKGIMKDENNKAVPGDVTITDPRGDTVAAGVSGDNGLYRLKTYLNPKTKYSFNFYNDSSFVYSRSFTTSDSLSMNRLVAVIPKLKKGKKFAVGSINFYGNVAKYLPESVPCMKNLWKLMKKNPGLEIMIVGHVNGCENASIIQKLSEDRAAAIRAYLVQNKIDPARIKTSGKGCSEMLYPQPQNEWEAEQNRRVEIQVLSY